MIFFECSGQKRKADRQEQESQAVEPEGLKLNRLTEATCVTRNVNAEHVPGDEPAGVVQRVYKNARQERTGAEEYPSQENAQYEGGEKLIWLRWTAAKSRADTRTAFRAL